jgi:hypothetical protein
MSVLAGDFWERAKDSLHAAEHVLPVSADTAASRAYYAAFYAVDAAAGGAAHSETLRGGIPSGSRLADRAVA